MTDNQQPTTDNPFPTTDNKTSRPSAFVALKKIPKE
jgi:hypothetical protein